MENNKKNPRQKNHLKQFSSTFFILCILLVTISSVSAANFDNLKGDLIIDETTSKYGKIDIYNWNIIGKIFDIKVTTLELKTNTDKCGLGCSARGEIIMYQDGVLIDDVRFMTLKEDGSWVEQPIRSYQFYIKIGEEEVDVDDYKLQCKNDKYILSNDSWSQKCSYVGSGSHKETREIWIEYNLGDEVEAGTYSIKLEGKKKPGRTVDWQITSQGKLIDDWAIWQDSFNINLQAYYNFQDDKLNQITSITLNLSNLDGNPAIVSTGCLIGNCVNISDANNNLRAMNNSLYDLFKPNRTVGWWFKAHDDGAAGFILMQSNAFEYGFRFQGGSVQFLNIGASSITKVADIFDRWVFLLVTKNDTHTSGYLNGTKIGTFPNSVDHSGGQLCIGSDCGGGSGVVGLLDEMGWWNRSLSDGGCLVGNGCGGEIGDLYNNGTGVTYQELTITLNSPNDDAILTTNNVIFNCSAEEGGGATIKNISLWTNMSGNFVLNETEDFTGIGGAKNTSIFNKNISDSSIDWNCRSYNTDGDNEWAIANRTVTIDTTSPVINITNPTGQVNLGGQNLETLLNWTVSDIGGLNTCWFTYNNTNTTVPCLDLNTTFTIQKDQQNLTFYANDTGNNVNSDSINWVYKVFVNNETFNNQTTEGATEIFSINFTIDSSIQVSTVNLIYNNTANSFPYSVTGDNVISQDSIVIPQQDITINISFHWNINLDDGSSINTSVNNQSVSIINIDNCSSFNTLIYNFTQYDEETKNVLTVNNTMDIQVNLYDTSKTILLVNFSDRFNEENPAQICLNSSILTTVNYSSYVIVKYFANLTGSEQLYSIEYYNILNQTISNTSVPKNIALYSLLSSDTTKFRLTFRDSAFVLAPNILVQVYRQYVEDNDFKIVEIPLTDSNGQTMLNLVKNDIIYNFIMVDEAGNVVAIFNSVTAFCQDFTIGECTINLNAESIGEDAYDYNEEFGISISSPTYNNSTEKISISFITDDLQPQTVRMEVFRNNDFGNRSVCTDSLTAASGILSCNISSITSTDQFLFTHVFVNNSLAVQDTINLNASALTFGILDGAFYAFLIILFLICLFMEDKRVLVASLGIGWVIVISLGLINGKLIGASSAGIWILVCIGIFIWKLSKEGRI